MSRARIVLLVAGSLFSLSILFLALGFIHSQGLASGSASVAAAEPEVWSELPAQPRAASSASPAPRVLSPDQVEAGVKMVSAILDANCEPLPAVSFPDLLTPPSSPDGIVPASCQTPAAPTKNMGMGCLTSCGKHDCCNKGCCKASCETAGCCKGGCCKEGCCKEGCKAGSCQPCSTPLPCTGTLPCQMTSHGVQLPASVCKHLGNTSTLFLAPGAEHCLCLWTAQEVQLRAPRTEAGNAETNRARRMWFSQMTQVELVDGQLSMPEMPGGFGPGSDIVIVGAGDHFEIWKAEDWSKYANPGANACQAESGNPFDFWTMLHKAIELEKKMPFDKFVFGRF